MGLTVYFFIDRFEFFNSIILIVVLNYKLECDRGVIMPPHF